jgi:release factor glutamine methyltransferase
MIAAGKDRTTPVTGRDITSRPPTLQDLVSRISRFLAERGVDTHHLDARLIVAHVVGIDPVDIYRNPDRILEKRHVSAALSLMRRRARGVPAAYLFGAKEFWSLSLFVDERVLIPRPETEVLVEESVTAARAPGREIRILDLGTGSGAVSIALAVELAGARIVSTDISPGALAVAGVNVRAHGLRDRITLVQGDLFGAVGTHERFDLIVSNPPYLTDEEMMTIPPGVRAEPDRALRGGAQGLSVIERMVSAAPGHLNAGGFLIFEIGAGQYEAAGRLIESTEGLSFSHMRRDYAGNPRVIIARTPVTSI